MGTRPKESIDARLLAAQVAIDNALGDSGILTALTTYGYNTTKINAGKTLLTSAQELFNKQKVEYGEQYEASEKVEKAWDEADKAYMKAIKVARVALKDNVKAQASLMLSGERKRTLSGWLEQADAFYTNLIKDTDLMNKMSEYGYNATKLNNELALVKSVKDVNLEQEKEKGEAQDATKKRDAKMDELDRWMSDFKEIAFVALDENPQWLEKLGFSGIE